MSIILTRPIPAGVETDAFGWRAAVPGVYDYPTLHDGQDYAAPRWTPIYAAHAGVVRHAGWDPLPGLVGAGYAVRIGAAQCSTDYLHMADMPLVSPGDHVTPGQIIGYVGTTGASNGPHLHFTLRLPGGPVDPRPYIESETMTPQQMQELKDHMTAHIDRAIKAQADRLDHGTGRVLDRIDLGATKTLKAIVDVPARILAALIPQHGPEGEGKSLPVRDVLAKIVPLARRVLARTEPDTPAPQHADE